MPDKIINSFFAITENVENSVRRIELTQGLVSEIRNLFVGDGETFIGEEINTYEYDNRYTPDSEEVIYVDMDELPAQVLAVKSNPISIQPFDISVDTIKALFWYEQETETFYFQNFDNRKRLDHKIVLFDFEDRKTFNKLEDKGFIIDHTVTAIHRDGKLYFKSFANANKIFSLADFSKAASEREIRSFATHGSLKIDVEWLAGKANSNLKRIIDKVIKSAVLDTCDTTTIKATGSTHNVHLELDEDGKIIFPNDIKQCRAILAFLHEGRFKGPLTNTLFETNSQRVID